MYLFSYCLVKRNFSVEEVKMAVTKNIQRFEEEQEEFEACVQCTQKCLKAHTKGNNNNDDGQGSPSYFFKVLLGDFAKFLRIPPAFAGRLRYQGLRNAFLEGPSGQIWIVTVCCTNTEMTFEKGWQAFVSDHSLDVGDFLVFKYAGESYFTVQIFGRSGCEKRDAFTVTKTQRKSRERSAESSHGVSDNVSMDPPNMRNGSQVHESPASATFIRSNTLQIDNSRRKRCTKSKDSAGSDEDITNLESTGCLDQGKEADFSLGKPVALGAEGESIKVKKSVAGACACQYHVDKPMCDVTPVRPVKKTKITPQKLQTPKDGGKRYVSSHYVSCRREVTKAEREKTIKAAQSFQSDNPFNLIVMKQSQVYQGFWLGLSRHFSKRWLPDQRVEITLLGPCGNKWRVQYLGDRSNPGLSGGWKSFAIDKNLEEGDVCVFELENKENCTLKVHIYRVVEECTPPRKVEGLKQLNEESEKRIVTVKKCSRKIRDTEATNKKKKPSKSTPNLGIKTAPQEVKANQGSAAITGGAFDTLPETET